MPAPYSVKYFVSVAGEMKQITERFESVTEAQTRTKQLHEDATVVKGSVVMTRLLRD